MSETAWWEDRPWRLVQTNLRERDMEDLEAERYVASLTRLHATVAMINTSGIVASYPTVLPFHTPSAFLHGDGLSTIVGACHEAGIKVIARTDFSKVRRPLYEQHPEWAYRRPDGEIVDEHGDVHVCPTSEYQQSCAPRIVEETITVLAVDGIFFNMAGFQTHDYRGVDHGNCHCRGCVDGFRAMFDLELPVVRDVEDAAYRRYLVFQRRTLRSAKRRMDALIRGLRPNLAIDRPSDDLGGFVRQESGSALDRAEWAYSASANTKWVVASLPRTVSSNSSVDFVDYPVRHVAVSPHRQRHRVAQALANGGGLDYYVIGPLDRRADRSGIAAIAELFAFYARHEEHYRGLRSSAVLGLVTGPDANAREFRGWFRVLAEHHVLFDVLRFDDATSPPLRRYRVLVVPDHQPISDELARTLERFVEDGGTLVATGRTGFRTDELEPRGTPALSCLGIERVRGVRDVRGAYLSVDDPSRFPRLDGVELVFLDGAYVDADYEATSEGRLRLIPPGPFGPPERCVLPDPTVDPGLVVRSEGSGSIVYVPWCCGEVAERHGQANTSSFMADVLQHHAGVEPVGGNLSPTVEVTLGENAHGAHLLHLVNGSGSLGVSSVEPIAMRDLEVVIPYEGRPTEVTALRSGSAIAWTATDGRLAMRLPELGLFEAVRIEPSEGETIPRGRARPERS
jgi:putative glycosyl hydrolase-like family 6 (GHL6) protein/glycosyl hydrolase family 42 (putative beta-galactosidase)